MARQKTEAPEKVAREIRVTRAHQFDDGNIAFDMEISGITIYGCMMLQRKKDGANFVSFPSKKGKDGTYYNHVFTKLNDEEFNAIDKQLDEIL